jgi:hypothetical protein
VRDADLYADGWVGRWALGLVAFFVLLSVGEAVLNTAQTVIAAAILRHLHAVINTGQAQDPAIATHGTQHTTQALAA